MIILTKMFKKLWNILSPIKIKNWVKKISYHQHQKYPLSISYIFYKILSELNHERNGYLIRYSNLQGLRDQITAQTDLKL